MIESAIDAIFFVFDYLLSLMPTLDLMQYVHVDSDMVKILSWANYLVPLKEFIEILDAWIRVILLYFAYLKTEWIIKDVVVAFIKKKVSGV